MKKTLLLCALLCAVGAMDTLAQTPGACERPQAHAYLDAGNVHAKVGIGGMPILPGAVAYEVPKDGGVAGLTCVMTWFGGLVEGQPRIAANTELWAGPLDDQGTPPDDCTEYDRIYEITRADIERYNRDGEITQNLQDWPWRLGAPVLDGDGDPDNYTLDGGDRPALHGDQMLWWVMNDAAGEHLQTKTVPMGMEIHAMAFAYYRPGFVSNVTFFRYTFVYKGAAPLEDAYFALYPEPDLGYSGDNFQGADTTLHLVYVYNADNYDGDEDHPSDYSYGANPPAIGFTFLPPPYSEPEGAPQQHNRTSNPFTGLAAFMAQPHYRRTAHHYYNYMRGLWHDGRPVTYGGDGRDFSDKPTTFFYPGDPVTGAFWSEMNMDGVGTRGPITYDTVISTGPFSMQPGDEHEIAFAIAWARGIDHFDSIRQLKQGVANLHRYADAFLSPDTRLILAQDVPPPQPGPLGFAQNYPNPFSISTTIRYSLPQAMRIRLRVFDVLGRAVATLVDEQQEGGIYEVPFEAGDLPGGVYFYRIEMDHLRFTKPMMLAR